MQWCKAKIVSALNQYSMYMYGGGGSNTPHLLDLATRHVSFTPKSLYSGEKKILARASNHIWMQIQWQIRSLSIIKLSTLKKIGRKAAQILSCATKNSIMVFSELEVFVQLSSDQSFSMLCHGANPSLAWECEKSVIYKENSPASKSVTLRQLCSHAIPVKKKKTV